jgi:Methyltransferase domain
MSKTCRSCRSPGVITSSQGTLYPFFVKRVYGLHIHSLGEAISARIDNTKDTKKKLLGKIFLGVLQRFGMGRTLLAFRSNVQADIRVCKACGFIGPELSYDQAALKNLYVDYRSDSYNAERSTFEPAYKTIQSHVGKSEQEIAARLHHMDEVIERYVDTTRIVDVVDWGGSEGKFIPPSLQTKNVWILDVSNEPLANKNYKRVDHVPENVAFDYVQVCHVLEHVSSPYEFMSIILGHIRAGGTIYIEVPQDQPDEEIQKFLSGDTSVRHGIHEHLNLFSLTSLRALAVSLGLKVLQVEKKSLDLGWSKATVLSGLFVKP